ncbi:MAG: hypothetical protein IJ551_01125 [Prevotella sp.]|nr:hypothetical protein [Prevotella sp.]
MRHSRLRDFQKAPPFFQKGPGFGKKAAGFERKAAGSRRYSLGIRDSTSTPTAIGAPRSTTTDYTEAAEDNTWYTTAGTKLQGKPKKAGIYVSRRKKITVK